MVGQLNHWMTALLHSRRRLISLLLVTIACDILCISAFTTKHASVHNRNQQHHQQQFETTTSIQLAFQDTLIESLQNGKTKNNDDQSSSTNDTRQRVPFIIQRLGRGTKKEVDEITQLCVDVFFNEQDDVPNNSDKNPVAPWKAVQLAYLRNYQRGDILSRNAFKKDQLVDLIVARRVYSVDASTNLNANAKLIEDNNDQIFNADQLPAGGVESKLVAGEIIGYCEMMEKKFDLGGNFEGEPEEVKANDNETEEEKEVEEKLRPYLGNLSVVKYARRSGVGSKLMDEGEQVVREWDAGHTEIVLQVEEDNPSAIQFYKRRGWEFVFADPTCRRYDTSGFFLKESRITKYAMIKRLDEQNADQNGSREAKNTGESLMDKLRNSFFVSK